MVGRLFSDSILAELYDAFCVGRTDFNFYLPLVMSADSVLDVGCGTGELLRLALTERHGGRLCGLDPAEAMLDVARRKGDVDWILGDLNSVDWCCEFDLVVMTGHAFQVFIEDQQLRKALYAIRSALKDDGRFVFETRNPLVKGWEAWSLENAVTIDHEGMQVTMTHSVETPVVGDVVSFRTTFSSSNWDEPLVSFSKLRFLDVDTLCGFLNAAGLVVEEQFGDWDRSPLEEMSPEIITVARRS